MEYLPIIAIIVSVTGLLLSLYQFIHKENKEDTTQLTTVIVKLEAISEGVIEIKNDMRSANRSIGDIRERLIAVENRSKSNTQRLNALDHRNDE